MLSACVCVCVLYPRRLADGAGRGPLPRLKHKPCARLKAGTSSRPARFSVPPTRTDCRQRARRDARRAAAGRHGDGHESVGRGDGDDVLRHGCSRESGEALTKKTPRKCVSLFSPFATSGAAPDARMALELYVDYVSQPCRALALFVRVQALPIVLTRVSLAKRDHRAPTFTRRFPLAKLPTLYDPAAALYLPESGAILRYLLRVTQGPHTLWPSDPRDAALADAALSWTLTELRPAAAGLVWATVLAPTAGGVADAGAAARAATALRAALTTLETWLASDGAAMAGLPTITAADVFAVCELDQLALLPVAAARGGGDADTPTAATLLAPYPRVRAWYARVVRRLTPQHYGEVTAPLRRAVARFAGGWWAGAEAARL